MDQTSRLGFISCVIVDYPNCYVVSMFLHSTFVSKRGCTSMELSLSQVIRCSPTLWSPIGIQCH
jgi:hypothetical protein